MRSNFILSKNRQLHKPSHCFVGNQTQYHLKHTRLAKTQKYHRFVKKKIFKKSNVRWEKKPRLSTQNFQNPKNTNPEISSTNPENQTQEHKKIKLKTHEHKPK